MAKISDKVKAVTLDVMTIAQSNSPEKRDLVGEVGELIQRTIDAEVEERAKMIRELIDADWMVTCDWTDPDKRQELMQRAEALAAQEASNE